MGIFDFFKKKPEIKKETVELHNLDSFIKNKKKEVEDKKNNFELIVKQRLSVFIKELEEKALILEHIDLKNIRADERARFIVKENLYSYIVNLKKLIENLKNIEDNFEINADSENHNLTGKILEKIDNFKKRSFMNYEKATFLIGKELGAVKNSISVFLKNLNNLILNSQDFTDSSEKISLMQSRLNQIKEIKNLREEINSLILDNIKKISKLEEQKINNELEIKNIKNSDKYLEEVEKNKEFEDKKRGFEKSLYELKQMIDFKSLANVFHYDPKKMNMISEHNLNFNQSFQKDNGMRLVKLLEEAGKSNHLVIKKINSVIEQIREFDDYKISNEELDKISSLEEKNKKIKHQTLEIEEENTKEKKKSEKLEQNKREIIDSIKTDLLNMNIEMK